LSCWEKIAEYLASTTAHFKDHSNLLVSNVIALERENENKKELYG